MYVSSITIASGILIYSVHMLMINDKHLAKKFIWIIHQLPILQMKKNKLDRNNKKEFQIDSAPLCSEYDLRNRIEFFPAVVVCVAVVVPCVIVTGAFVVVVWMVGFKVVLVVDVEFTVPVVVFKVLALALEVVVVADLVVLVWVMDFTFD